MKKKYISDREKVKEAIIEIVKNKKNEGVEPTFATVGDIVYHTGMCISDVNCELSMLRSSGVINKYRDWETPSFFLFLDRKSTRLNSSHSAKYRMPSSA